MFRTLTIIFLLGLSYESFAGDLQVRNGKLAYPLTEKFNENGFRPWKIIGGGIDQEYQSRFDKSLHVREASTGLRSASTVPVTIEQKVSRSTVLKNLLSKARVGGKFARVGGGPVGFAVSTAAFYLVDAALSKEGYE